MAENTKTPTDSLDLRSALGIKREKRAEIGDPFEEGDEKLAGAALLLLLAANFFNPDEARQAVINALLLSIQNKRWELPASDVN